MLSRGGRDGWVSAGACLAAACTLSLTLQISEGQIPPAALVGLGWTLALSALALLTSGLGTWGALAERGLTACLVIALTLQLECWFGAEAGHHLLTPGQWPYAPLYFGLALESLAAGVLLASPWAERRWLIPLLLAAFVFIGLWMMRVAQAPRFDVWIFQHESVQALLRGENPYTSTIPDVYGPSNFYGEGMVKDGRVLIGNPYPPFSIYVATLGYLFGDLRYAQLACMVVAAALMAYEQRSRLAVGAAALFLLTPRGLLVLQLSFTEPIVVCLLAATVFCARRYPRALPYVLGCLLAAKQYTIFVVPLLPLLTPLRGRALFALLARAALTALALTLPLVLPDPRAFFWNVVELQFYQPFRMDSLSYLPWWVNQGHAQPPLWMPFALMGLAIALALWRAPRTPAGFAAAVAFVYCTFFAFNKQAFLNYYYFVVGALCVALAATRVPPSRPPRQAGV